MKPKPKSKEKRKPRIIKLEASPEEVARQIFDNAKPPNPSIRVRNRPK